LVKKINIKALKPNRSSAPDPVSNRRPITLKDIAEICGLAIPTVSRALSGASDIALKTRKRVRQVADQIGYIPNRAGVHLRTGKTNVIALMLPTEKFTALNYSSSIIDSIAEELRTTPYHLIITPFFPNEDPMIPIKYIVETRSADAIIINQIQPEDPRVAYLLKYKFPFVTHGRTIWANQHAYLDFDNYTFASIAVRQLARRGRKSIVLLAPPISQSYAQDMIAGMTATSKELDLTVSYIEQPKESERPDTLTNIIIEYLTAHPDIDGIITSTVFSALASSMAIEHRGLVVGQDIDIFAKEPRSFLMHFRPDIVSISENVIEAGTYLAKAACAAISNPQAAPLQMLVSPKENRLG